MNAGHLRKPTENHVPWETTGCGNYYNVTYRNTGQRCKPCRSKAGCELCETGIGIRREDNIFVCDSCDDAFPYKKERE